MSLFPFKKDEPTKQGTEPNPMIEIQRLTPLVPLDWSGSVYQLPTGGRQGESLPVIILDLYTLQPGEKFDPFDYEGSLLYVWLTGSIGRAEFHTAYQWAREIFAKWTGTGFLPIQEFLANHFSGATYRLSCQATGREFDIELRSYELVEPWEKQPTVNTTGEA